MQPALSIPRQHCRRGRRRTPHQSSCVAEPIGPPADVHGLGIVIYEALTGCMPFANAPDQATLLRRQLHDPIPSVRELRPDVPAAVDEVIQRATAKSVSGRYGDIRGVVDDLIASVHVEAEPRERSAGTVTLVGSVTNPYRGLRAFHEADAGDFFGRARLVTELTSRFDGRGAANRFVTVVGGSGSGKSSAVRAGLIPALRAGAVNGSAGWFVTTMLPGRHRSKSSNRRCCA